MAEQTRRNTQSDTTSADRGAKTSPTAKPAPSARETTPASGGINTAGIGGNGGLVQQMRSTATDAFENATSKATEKLEEQKSNLSSGLTGVASGIREMGSSLAGSGTDNQFARIASEASSAAAKGIDRAAAYFQQKDLNAVYHDVEDLARRNPAIFLGGAFALGFLAARFLKSSKPRRLTTAAGRPFNMPPQDRPRMGGEAARGM